MCITSLRLSSRQFVNSRMEDSEQHWERGELSSRVIALASRRWVSLSAGFCPVACRIIHFDSDYKGIIRVGLTVYDAGMRVEMATD